MEQAVIQAPHSTQRFLSIVIITVMSLFPSGPVFPYYNASDQNPQAPNAKSPGSQEPGLDRI